MLLRTSLSKRPQSINSLLRNHQTCSNTSTVTTSRTTLPKQPRRTLIPAPGPNTGPILERRADRELPEIQSNRGWLKTIPIFVVTVGAAMLGIFNYQKSTSSVVSSTLYALRTSPQAREILGDEIYFAQQIPWISGEMNQLHGRIDISFWVKGTKGQGKMRFKSVRPDRMSYFRTEEWSLETEDGTVVQLLDSDTDPFRKE
ncbi:hypothetical protein N7539_000747 [Penicillium diatomitis]|uniref:Cytochrome oxidase complex assembly protein n=1 Tax=Penicillium diatomitis TaxID=2819901 RepID=A0A9W9XMC2_9EURO|nr:uncharacterized protein N7539_000747 [Penicillium diatomitis]KAJ5495631.1 hypothetical protein N7539_000747 [Penicillium diatomitis]